MSYIPNSVMPHARAKDADSSRDAGANGGDGSIRHTLDRGVGAARDAVQHVPAKAWTIGAVVAGVAASVAIGAYVASNGEGRGRSGKSGSPRTGKRRAAGRSPRSAKAANAA